MIVSIPVNVRNILSATGMGVSRNFGGIDKRFCQFEMSRILKDSAQNDKSTACTYSFRGLLIAVNNERKARQLFRKRLLLNRSYIKLDIKVLFSNRAGWGGGVCW